MLEEVLMDVQKANQDWNVVLLRYFNPIGAHQSGKIGEESERHSKQSDALYHAGGCR